MSIQKQTRVFVLFFIATLTLYLVSVTTHAQNQGTIQFTFATNNDVIYKMVDDRLKVTWRPVDGAKGYRLKLVNLDSRYEEIEESNDTKEYFHVDDIGGDGGYYIQVEALDGNGNSFASGYMDFFLHVQMEDVKPASYGSVTMLQGEDFDITYDGFPGADEYRIKIVKEHNTSDVIMNETTRRKSYTVDSDYFQEGTTACKIWLAAYDDGDLVAQNIVYLNVNVYEEEKPDPIDLEVDDDQVSEGDILRFTFVTNKATSRVGMSTENRQVFQEWEDDYTLSGGNKVWTIEKSMASAGNKEIILWAGDEDKWYKGLSVKVSVKEKELPTIDDFYLINPSHGSEHLLTDDLEISWTYPDNVMPDSYKVYMYYNDSQVYYTQTSDQTVTISESKLERAGRYYFEVYANKDGWRSKRLTFYVQGMNPPNPSIMEIEVPSSGNKAGTEFRFILRTNRQTETLTMTDLYDNEIATWSDDYEDQGDTRIWYITKNMTTAGNRTLRFYPGNGQERYAHYTIDFLVEENESALDEPQINSPYSGNTYNGEEGVKMTWQHPYNQDADHFILKVFNHSHCSYTTNKIDDTEYTLPAEAFPERGEYWIELYAQKDGWKEGTSSVRIEIERPKPDAYEVEIGEGKVGEKITFKVVTNLSTTRVKVCTEQGDTIASSHEGSRRGDNITYQMERAFQVGGYRYLTLYVGDDNQWYESFDIELYIEENNQVIDDFPILSPQDYTQYKPRSTVNVDWTAPSNAKGCNYNLRVYRGEEQVYVKEGLTGTFHTIPAHVFNRPGVYSIDIYALEEGWTSSVSNRIIQIETDLSNWAVKPVESIRDKGLITENLMDELLVDPKTILDRGQFCQMLVELYESYTRYNKPAIGYDATQGKSFVDIGHRSQKTQSSIRKANALGIVNGTSDTTFNPDGPVTREILATMLRNTFYAMYGYDISMAKGEWRIAFQDRAHIANWALESVRFINGLGILNGNGQYFSPKTKATNEMGLVLIERAYKVFGDFNSLVDYRIKAYSKISRYTPYVLECRYDNVKIGEISKSATWSSSNERVASSNGIGLYAKATGTTTLTAKYRGHVINKTISVNVPVVPVKTVEDTVKPVQEAGFREAMADTNIFTESYLNQFIQKLRCVRQAELEDNFVENGVATLLTFGDFNTSHKEMKAFFMNYAITSVGSENAIAKGAAKTFTAITSLLPESSRMANLNQQEYNTVKHILGSGEWGKGDFVKLEPVQKMKLSEKMQGYFKLGEQAGHKLRPSRNDEALMELLDGIQDGDLSLDEVNKLHVIDEDCIGKVNKVVSKNPKLAKAANVLKKVGEYTEIATLTYDTLQQLNKISNVNTEMIANLRQLKEDIPREVENYAGVMRSLESAIHELENKYLMLLETTFKTAKSLVKVNPNPYWAWFRSSQDITAFLTGDFLKSNFSVRNQVQVMKVTAMTLVSKYKEYRSNPTANNQEQFMTILSMFIKFTESAVNLDIASEQGGLLFYVADYIYQSMNDMSLPEYWRKVKNRELDKIEVYKEFYDSYR